MWPSSSGTAEDRNHLARAVPVALLPVAVVLRDGGGSQQPHLHAVRRVGRRWPSSSGTAEDRNSAPRPETSAWPCGRRPPGRRRIATPWAGRGCPGPPGGRRPPGRRRIATTLRARSPSPCCQWPSSSGTAEDRNRSWSSHAAPWRSWPSSSGTAEDRNSSSRTTSSAVRPVAVVLRDGGGSQQRVRAPPQQPGRGWPSSSGTAEDRNTLGDVAAAELATVAVVLRDGGGSQLRLRGPEEHVPGCGRRPPGRRRIATGTPSPTCGRWKAGGRRLSGWRRISTLGGCAVAARSSSGRPPGWWRIVTARRHWLMPAARRTRLDVRFPAGRVLVRDHLAASVVGRPVWDVPGATRRRAG